MFPKLSRHIVNIMKMCIWGTDGDRINLDKIYGLLNLVILGLICNAGYGICVINFSYGFQQMFLKLNGHIVAILKMCIWGFGGDKMNVDIITAF